MYTIIYCESFQHCVLFCFGYLLSLPCGFYVPTFMYQCNTQYDIHALFSCLFGMFMCDSHVATLRLL